LETILCQPLAPYTHKTITSADELHKQLAVIRQQGYAIDDGEMEEGVYAVAAPIYNRQGPMVAAVSVPSPTSRMTPERIPDIVQALKEAAKRISLRLGWTA
jgi:DNA-binding IclR family transcriptional regulator